MPKVDVYSIEKEKVDAIEIDDRVFAAEISDHLFHDVVRWQLAGRRAGTHAAKGRSQVSGGGKKPWRQKGTGRARQGSRRAPHFRGGGVAHGPHPRGHAHDLPKKVRRAALRGALSRRLAEGKLTVFDGFALPELKTKRFREVMERFEFGDLLLVIPDGEDTVRRSARNLPNATVLPVEGLNVYDVLRFENVALTRAAIEKVVARLAP